jgi:hypothetical protein
MASAVWNNTMDEHLFLLPGEPSASAGAGKLIVMGDSSQSQSLALAQDDSGVSTVNCSLTTDICEPTLLEQLRESDRRISTAWRSLSKASMCIGWDGYFIKRHNGWRALGYEDEKHYRIAKGISRTNWYRLTGMAERLANLAMEEFLSMTLDNAELLSKQPPSAKCDRKLLAKAQTLTEAQFAIELEAAAAQRENREPEAQWVTMAWRVLPAQRKVILEGLAEWEHEHGLDNEGYALELMIAEYRQRPTLVGFLSESIDWLGREVVRAKSLDDLLALRAHVAAHVQDMQEILLRCCGEMEAASEKPCERVAEPVELEEPEEPQEEERTELIEWE